MVSDIVQAIDALSFKDMLWPLIILAVLIFSLGYIMARQAHRKSFSNNSDIDLSPYANANPTGDNPNRNPTTPSTPASSSSGNDSLEKQLQAKNDSLVKIEQELKEAHQQIDAQEKLASVGILSAGIAHEIKNPLNFINNFSDTTVEIVNELKEALSPILEKADPKVRDDILGLTKEIADNCLKMQTHGKRAESIIKNMLIQARTSYVEKEPVDVNSLLDEFVALAYHGMRAQDSNFNAKIEKLLDPKLPKITVSPQSVGRVFLNLINNALYAINERAQILKKEDPKSTYMPTITINSTQTDNDIIIKIRDNGEGIPKEIQPKIFERFFTTKPAGHGTGLGLPICYDIVVAEHGGKLSVESTPHEFTEFTIQLPKK